ncbi:MAG: MutS family DNA mismatch repair protein [Clostridiales bacterium]|nr:MutS family DNA mismatch repair protein [Clostridiales bacterium]
MNERVYHSLKILFLIAAGTVAYFSYTLGRNTSKLYFLGFLLAIVLIYGSYYFTKKRDKQKALRIIEENWGQFIDKKRNLTIVRRYFDLLAKESKEVYLDDQTWEDLDMNEIYTILDRNLTSSGEQVLYHILRNPLFKEEPLRFRDKIIRLFQEDKELRERIQLGLYYVGRMKDDDLSNLLWKEAKIQPYMRLICNLAVAMTLVSLILIPFVGSAAFLPMVACFGINVYIHSNHGVKNEVSIRALRYLSELIRFAGSLSKEENPALKPYIDEVKDIYEKVKSIAKGNGNIGVPEGVDLIYDYGRILLLIEERSYYRVIRDINNNRELLKRLYRIVGELDCFISIASYREELEKFSTPGFITGQLGIKVEGLIHPLIEEPVPNDISIGQGGVIITGSNMSGKSTFLRSIGICALFAQTFYMVLADKYEAPFYHIMSSISPSDSIVDGKSYYLREAESILRIIKQCGQKHPILCIVDEIFRGTNPVERISASAEIMDYIISNNATAIIATHDLELTELMQSRYECYYFAEDVNSDEGIKFDYKIRKGVSNTRNAIKLLTYLGYPESIVKKAEERIN